MIAVTMGQAVVVIERRHPLACEEGTVMRAKPDTDGRVRVHFDAVDGEPQSPDDWRAVELTSLGAMPAPGERYEWNDRNNMSRTPFTVGERLPAGYTFAGHFALMHDDATPADRERGHTAIATAAELARFADRIDTPAPTTPPAAAQALIDAALDWDTAVTMRQGTVQSYQALRRAVRTYRATQGS